MTWTPLFADPKFGILPLLGGTLLSTFVALIFVAGRPDHAIYLSEFASPRAREIIKPILEMLSGVPTVIYGFFALAVRDADPRRSCQALPGFNIPERGVGHRHHDHSLCRPGSRTPCGPSSGAARWLVRARCDLLETALRVVLPAATSVSQPPSSWACRGPSVRRWSSRSQLDSSPI